MQPLYYPDKTLYTKDGCTYLYPDGKLKTKLLYLGGKLHGECLLFWPNGNLKRRCHFTHGIRHGVDQIFQEDGTKIDETVYENGCSIEKGEG